MHSDLGLSTEKADVCMKACCLCLGSGTISGDSMQVFLMKLQFVFQEATWYAACYGSTKGQSLGVTCLVEKLGLISVITVWTERSDPFFPEQSLLEAFLPSCLWNKKISYLDQIIVITGKIKKS